MTWLGWNLKGSPTLRLPASLRRSRIFKGYCTWKRSFQAGFSSVREGQDHPKTEKLQLTVPWTSDSQTQREAQLDQTTKELAKAKYGQLILRTENSGLNKKLEDIAVESAFRTRAQLMKEYKESKSAQWDLDQAIVEYQSIFNYRLEDDISVAGVDNGK